MDQGPTRLKTRRDEIAALHEELGIPRNYGLLRRLVPQIEADPDALATISVGVSRPFQLLLPVRAAWEQMNESAARAKVSLVGLSGFRSVARQAEIIRGKLRSGQLIDDILEVSAAPGFSEHHTGRAIDIGTPNDPPLEVSFVQTAAYAWLEANAAAFGFRLSYPRDNPHGISFEPWHWCWHADLGSRSA